jgi:hypothetical protein
MVRWREQVADDSQQCSIGLIGGISLAHEDTICSLPWTSGHSECWYSLWRGSQRGPWQVGGWGREEASNEEVNGDYTMLVRGEWESPNGM